MSDELTPLEALAAAIQGLANDVADGPELVDNAVVVWESVSFDEDGLTQRCIRYAVPSENFTMSGTLGLLEAGKFYIRRDVFSRYEDEDDE